MFYEVRNLTQPATIFKETSVQRRITETDENRKYKDSLIRFFSSTDIAF